MCGALWISALLDVLMVMLLVDYADAQSRCFFCSDSNIEVHYGAFFDNPRELQGDSFDDRQPKCIPGRALTRVCHSACFTLNVTSTHIRNGELLPFGVAHGCSTKVLAPSRLQGERCFSTDVLLKTLPPYIVQARYCFCTGDECNDLKDAVEPPIKQKSRSTLQEVILLQQQANTSPAAGLHLLACLYILFLCIPIA